MGEEKKILNCNLVIGKYIYRGIYIYVGRIAIQVQKFEEINTKMLTGIVFE